jgi:uncharacterized protein (DUF1330 family)
MKTVDPDRSRLPSILAQLPADAPIVMLNLLRYRDLAAYPASSGHAPCTGREAYARYAAVALKKVTEAGGAPIWMGEAHAALIAPAEERWDEVLLVRYPSVAAFVGMLQQEDYLAATVHRTAALEDARLIATTERGAA